LGLEPMSLGLDLRGGMHLVYQVDVEGAVAQLLQRMERDFRKVLRDAKIPYVDVAVAGSAVTVRLRDAAQTQAAREQLAEYDPTMTVTADAVSGVLTAALTETQVKERQDFAIQQNITALGNRVNALGVAEAVVQRQGLNRIAVQVPGVQDASEVVRLLGKVATLEFRLVDTTGSPVEAERTGKVPLGSRLYHERDGNPVLLKRDVIATGEQLIDASFAPSQGEPAVSVRLDSRGGEEMLRTTRENLKKPMAVVFIEKERELVERDGQQVVVDRSKEEVINVATIQGVFSNNFQITGLSAAEGSELAKLLRAGALAAPIFIVEQRVIGPGLGQD
ncbi:MAG: SecDF P1 head subdomain-containing protein, partial [Myxococcota bacterium]